MSDEQRSSDSEDEDDRDVEEQKEDDQPSSSSTPRKKSSLQRGTPSGRTPKNPDASPSTSRSGSRNSDGQPSRRKTAKGPLESPASPTPFSTTRRRSRIPVSSSTNTSVPQTPKAPKATLHDSSNDSPSSPPAKSLTRKKSRAPSGTSSPKLSPTSGARPTARMSIQQNLASPKPRMNRRSIAKMGAQLPVEHDLDGSSASEEESESKNESEEEEASELTEAQDYAAKLGIDSDKPSSYFDKIKDLKVKQAEEAERLEEEKKKAKKKKKGFLSLLRSPMGLKNPKKVAKDEGTESTKDSGGADIYSVPLEELGAMLVPKEKTVLDTPGSKSKSARASRSIDVDEDSDQEVSRIPDSKKTSLSDIRRMMEKSKAKSEANLTGRSRGGAEPSESSSDDDGDDDNDDMEQSEPLKGEAPARRSGRRSTVASPDGRGSGRSKSPTYNSVARERRSAKSPGSNQRAAERRESRRAQRMDEPSRSASPTSNPRALERRQSRRGSGEDGIRSKSPTSNHRVHEKRESRRTSGDDRHHRGHHERRESRSHLTSPRSKSPSAMNKVVLEKRGDLVSDSPAASRRNQRRSIIPESSRDEQKSRRRSDENKSKKDKKQNSDDVDTETEDSTPDKKSSTGRKSKRKSDKKSKKAHEEFEMSWVRKTGPTRKSMPALNKTANEADKEGSSSGRRRRASEMPNSSNRSRHSAGTPTNTSHSREEGSVGDPQSSAADFDDSKRKDDSDDQGEETGESQSDSKNAFVSRRSRPSHIRRHPKKGPRPSKKDDASTRDSLKESAGMEIQPIENEEDEAVSALPIDDLESAFARAKVGNDDRKETVSEPLNPGDADSSSEEGGGESNAINPVPHLPPKPPQPVTRSSPGKPPRPTPPPRPPRPGHATNDSSSSSGLSLAQAFDRAQKAALATGPRSGNDGDSVFTAQTEDSADMYYRGNGSIVYVQPAENVDAAQLVIDDGKEK